MAGWPPNYTYAYLQVCQATRFAGRQPASLAHTNTSQPACPSGCQKLGLTSPWQKLYPLFPPERPSLNLGFSARLSLSAEEILSPSLAKANFSDISGAAIEKPNSTQIEQPPATCSLNRVLRGDSRMLLNRRGYTGTICNRSIPSNQTDTSALLGILSPTLILCFQRSTCD